jgi:chloride channel protein, CIC family
VFPVSGSGTPSGDVLFTDSLLGLRARFKAFTAVPTWVHPAIGGALTGTLAVVGIFWLQQNGITGGGYGTLSLALSGSLPIKVLVGLCVLKLAATVCSYSSGGAGGFSRPPYSSVECLGGRLDVWTSPSFITRGNRLGPLLWLVWEPFLRESFVRR